MTDADNSVTTKQLTTLALVGLVILAVFAAGFIWLVYYVRVSGDGGGEAFLACAPYWLYPYLVVSSVYTGFFGCTIRKRQDGSMPGSGESPVLP